MTDTNTAQLTHFDATGQAHMVDVAAKNDTHRIAVAAGTRAFAGFAGGLQKACGMGEQVRPAGPCWGGRHGFLRRRSDSLLEGAGDKGLRGDSPQTT